LTSEYFHGKEQINKRKEMKTSKRPLITIVTFTALLLCFPLLIYAYIDPGTGSYIIQIVIAAFIGISLAIRIFWKKIKIFFINIFQKKHLDK